MIFSAQNYPALASILELIRLDNNMPDEEIMIPEKWIEHLPLMEQASAALRDDIPAPEDLEAHDRIIREGFCYLDSEIEVFANGEETVVDRIAKRSPELMLLHGFLNDFFSGFYEENE